VENRRLYLGEERGARKFNPAVLSCACTWLAFLAIFAFYSSRATPIDARPNIVFILADDLGYGDLSCQNSASRIQTPRLDRLASQGMRFTDAHAPSALCTPTRYSILTGQYCWRSRLKSGVLNMWDEPLIGPDQLTVAGMLRNVGYRTACFGKWHLGLSWPFVGRPPAGFDTTVKCGDINWTGRISGGPVDRGFDYYFGMNVPNEAPFVFIENDRTVGVPTVEYPTVSGQQGHFGGPGMPGWDWSAALPLITSNTVNWIRQSAAQTGKPFFLYAPLVGPHQPVVPSASFQGSSRAGIYGDYVQELDWAVGQLLDALDATGASPNTLVIFTSDNGPDEFAYDRLQQFQHASMGQLRGIKNDIWEGGHRVPFLARWPGKIPGASANSQTICLVDFMHTVADVAGATVPTGAAPDSVSFLPSLLRTNLAPQGGRSLIFESGRGQFGIRSNNWMFIDSSTGDGHNPEMEPEWFKQLRNYAVRTTLPSLLYDLGLDPAERNNLVTSRPEMVGILRAELRLQRANVAWSGAASGEWNLSQNWAPQQAPAGADITYSNRTGFQNLSQSITNPFSINSIIFDRSLNSNVTLVAKAGGSLAIANGIDMGMASASFSVNVPLSLSQSQVWEVSSNSVLNVGAALDLSGHSLMLCGSGQQIFSGPISGGGQLIVRSGGSTLLESSNSFAAGTELSGGGFLVARNNHSLGTGPLIIPNNSTLVLAPGIHLVNEAMIQGYGTEYNGQQFGALAVCSNGTAVYEGAVRLGGDVGLRADGSESVLAIASAMTGDANVTILPGAGVVSFRTNQLFAGSLRIQGQLSLDSPQTLPATTQIMLLDSNSANLYLNGNQAVANLSGGGRNGGNINLGSNVLTIAAPAGVSIYSGCITGTGGISKVGPGKLMFAGTNTYLGGTRIGQGELEVDGAFGPTKVFVEGGVLSGSGSIAGSAEIRSGSLLVRDHMPRALIFGGDISFGAQGTLEVEIDPFQNTAGNVQAASIAFGGRLLVHNLVPAWGVTNGQTFRVASSTHSTGKFLAITPNPAPGFVWSFDPARGLLTAVAQPTLQFTASSGIFSWSDARFHLQVSTNLSGWFDYPGGASSPVTQPIDPTRGALFFRLAAP